MCSIFDIKLIISSKLWIMLKHYDVAELDPNNSVPTCNFFVF